jgi:hypothetical protein
VFGFRFTTPTRPARQRLLSRWLTGRPRRATAVLCAAAPVVAGLWAATPASAGEQAMKTNPYWAQAQQAFNPKAPAHDVRHVYSNAAGAIADKGVVVLRLFIPAARSAGGALLGDDRGFSGSPGASSRGVLVWDVSTGKVSVTVTHSATPAGPEPSRPLTALPLHTLAYNGNFHQDVKRGVNEVGFASSKGAMTTQLSLLNPLTNNGRPPWSDFGAWSVDYKATISRIGPDNYKLTHMEGNGYPAVEAYYYPRYIPANAGPQAWVIGKRSISPQFVGMWIDGGGGVAAVDYLSWNVCSYTGSGNNVSCRNTASYGHAQQLGWREMWGIGFPSASEWKAPWVTNATATAAM